MHACCPGTSHGSLPTAPGSPKPATAMSSNLKHSPGNLKGSIPSRSPARVSMWLLAAKPPSRGLGAGLGLPALFGFPLPALEPQTPVWPWRRPDPGKSTKALYSWAGKSPSQGKHCRQALHPAPPSRPPTRLAPAAQELQQASSGPQSCFAAPSEPASPGGTGRGTQALHGGARAQRDMYIPKRHMPPEPQVTSQDTRVPTHAHASHLCCPQSSLGTWAQGPGSPAQQALRAG